MRGLSIIVLTLAGLVFVPLSRGQPVPSKDSEVKGPQKWALLIGINDYAEINDLKYPCQDVQALRDRLLAMGFRKENVILLHDREKRSAYQPFKASIEHHLDEMLKTVGRNDLVMFVFSGHGVDLNGTSYLCSIEAQMTAPEKTMVSLEQIYRRLDSCRAARKLLLIDACRNDPRPGGEKTAKTSTATLTRFTRSLERPPQGILVLSSCKPGQVSVEDDKIGHGVFMHFIVEGLRGEADRNGGNGNNSVSLFELFRYAGVRTRTYVARTRDQIQTPVLRGKITGDYELADVSTRALEVEAVWSDIRKKPDMYAETNQILRWYARMYKRMMGGNRRSKTMRNLPANLRQQFEQMYKRQEEMIDRQVRQPEAIVLSNPSLITTNSPETLLAIQRAYAFGIRGDWDGAIAAGTEAILLEPDNPFAYLMRGMAYVGRAKDLMAANSLMGGTQDPETIARYLRMAESNPAIGRQVGAVLSELKKVHPGIAHDLEAAKDNPEKLKQVVQKALAKLDALTPLAMALKDYRKIDLGTMIFLKDKAQLQSGSEVVGSVSGYVNYCDAVEVNGEWVRVEGVPGVDAAEAWVHKDQITMVFSYYDQFQIQVR